MQEMNIIPPEGYEVDKEKSTFERIVFKKKITRPESWEEFCEHTPVEDEYFIDDENDIIQSGGNYYRNKDYDKNLCKTQAEAEAFLALIQLRRLWWEWKDERPNQQDPIMFSFKCSVNEWCISYFQYNMFFPIWFYSEETAKLFLETFKDLFDKVKWLYV